MRTKKRKLPVIKIGDRLIGANHSTYIIAEIGINHNGDINIAKRLIDVAAKAKVDAVKFQKRHLPCLYREDILNETMKYEQNFQYMIPILKEVELSNEEFYELKSYSIEKGLEFLCTPSDIPSVNFLVELGVNAFKIASADLTNLELLGYVADLGKAIFLSTGMSYPEDIEKAVKLLRDKEVPFALLHCRSSYPVWPRDVNLRMINKLAQYGCPVGYSGHDIGIIIPLVASSMGACIIEKHITLDKNMRGPDHKISLEPFELKRLVRDIRVADQAMSKPKRFLLRGEIMNRELFGKSLLAAVPIKAGSRITREMIRVQGPGKGLSPNRISKLVGRKIRRNIKKADFFFEEDIEKSNGKDFTNSFRTKWGIICRFRDINEMLVYGPKIIEFHLAAKDFSFGFKPHNHYSQDLIIHVPEYMGDRLFDLCSASEEVRRESVDMVQKSIDLARNIMPHFSGTPKLILHPGAMSLNAKLKKKPLEDTLYRSIEDIDGEGIEILLENLPPYPWYFGGQWKGNYFMDDKEIRSFCEKSGINICFDLSHAALYCNAKCKCLCNFIENLKPFIRHIHFADAYGLAGEGVQIGEGDIDFPKIMPLFSDYNETWAPEIWRGHLQNGKGFIDALKKLKAYNI